MSNHESSEKITPEVQTQSSLDTEDISHEMNQSSQEQAARVRSPPRAKKLSVPDISNNSKLPKELRDNPSGKDVRVFSSEKKTPVKTQLNPKIKIRSEIFPPSKSERNKKVSEPNDIEQLKDIYDSLSVTIKPESPRRTESNAGRPSVSLRSISPKRQHLAKSPRRRNNETTNSPKRYSTSPVKNFQQFKKKSEPKTFINSHKETQSFAKRHPKFTWDASRKILPVSFKSRNKKTSLPTE